MKRHGASAVRYSPIRIRRQTYRLIREIQQDLEYLGDPWWPEATVTIADLIHSAVRLLRKSVPYKRKRRTR